MNSNTPEQAEVEETFAVLSRDRGTVHRALITRLYLNPKAWFEARNSQGETLLLAAIREGHGEAVSLLLKKGFPPDAWNNHLETGLHLADSTTVCSLLLSKTRHALALESDEKGDLPLHVHLRRGNADVVKMLLDSPLADAQILRRNAKGQTPLFDAAAHSWGAVLPLLLMGADPRITDKTDQRPEVFTTDAKTRKKLQAFCAHFDRCDESSREEAMAENAARKSALLAQRAKDFVLLGEQEPEADMAAQSTPPAP